jgi:hypothetical protein
VNLAGAEPPSLRSVKDVRPRIPDELDRPVRRETSSHRGWEIRHDQFTIAANTSLEQARWAAAEVAKARGEMAELADRFTDVHRQADFGLNSLQVMIDGEPPRDRDAPAATINVLGIQTQVLINVSPGQPPLADQLLRLREATAFALLHAAELDSTLPPWVSSGLAAHVAVQGQAADSSQPKPQPDDFAPRGLPLGGEEWRQSRALQDRLERRPQNLNASAARVAFLLTANDAEHAPRFLSSLAAAIGQGRSSAANHSTSRRRGEGQPAETSSQLDQLVAVRQAGYQAWLKDPQAGQPEFKPDDETPDNVVALQREMLVVLKLQRRVQSQRAAATPVKEVAFDRDKGRTAVENLALNTAISMSELMTRLRDPAQSPLATLDVDGRLLLSTDRRRLSELLGWDGQRYQVKREADQWVLATRLADGRELSGWLAENPDRPSRPLAKFKVSEPIQTGARAN